MIDLSRGKWGYILISTIVHRHLDCAFSAIGALVTACDNEPILHTKVLWIVLSWWESLGYLKKAIVAFIIFPNNIRIYAMQFFCILYALKKNGCQSICMLVFITNNGNVLVLLLNPPLLFRENNFLNKKQNKRKWIKLKLNLRSWVILKNTPSVIAQSKNTSVNTTGLMRQVCYWYGELATNLSNELDLIKLMNQSMLSFSQCSGVALV